MRRQLRAVQRHAAADVAADQGRVEAAHGKEGRPYRVAPARVQVGQAHDGAHAGQVAGRGLKLLDGGVFNPDAAVGEHLNVGVRKGIAHEWLSIECLGHIPADAECAMGSRRKLDGQASGKAHAQPKAGPLAGPGIRSAAWPGGARASSVHDCKGTCRMGHGFSPLRWWTGGRECGKDGDARDKRPVPQAKSQARGGLHTTQDGKSPAGRYRRGFLMKGLCPFSPAGGIR